MRIKIFLFLVLLSSTLSLKVGVINDIHYNPFYDPTTFWNFCFGLFTFDINWADRHFNSSQASFPSLDEPNAPLGRRLCDPPLELTETMMKVLQAHTGGLDLLLMPGDFVAHGYSMEKKLFPLFDTYYFTKQILNETSSLIPKHFPNTVFVPAWGNNDFKFHYQCPINSDKEEQLSYAFYLWFEKSGPKMNNILEK